LWLAVLPLLSGCGPGLVFNTHNMTPDQMLARADLVFVGVIERHQFENSPFLRFTLPPDSGRNAGYWRVLRRDVQIETVLRGSEPLRAVPVYEIFWTGGSSGDWNSTHDGERDLFLVRMENGRYHVVRDWLRSIFPVTTGPHDRLPLDESRPLWERIALMNWWIRSSDPNLRIGAPYFRADPGGTLSRWRVTKLERGLLRHPSLSVQLAGCRGLLLDMGLLQDECWDQLSESERSHLKDGGFFCCTADEIRATRSKTEQRGASWWWQTHGDRETRRMFTAMSIRNLRVEFCRLYEREYPGDRDIGCPADQPPPATIVTEAGDVPLLGPWPK
jgi:hypothetical protein